MPNKCVHKPIVLFCVLKEDEMYWPDENAPMTFGFTTVTYKGTKIMGNTTELKLESSRFGKV